MSEPMSGSLPVKDDLKLRCGFLFAVLVAIGTGTSASAGVIRQKPRNASERLRIEKSNLWSNYWVRALREHRLNLHGPKIPRVFARNADGSVPLSPFVQYMQWREGLNPKRFATFHPEITQMLRRVKSPATPTTPGTIVPPTPGTPIEPPDFTPIIPAFVTPPPETPEPTTMALACAMIAGAALHRRIRKA